MGTFGPLELLLLAIVFAASCGALARRRGRNTAGWAALGFVLGPIALLVLLLLPRDNTAVA
jgi:hypothetical protein